MITNLLKKMVLNDIIYNKRKYLDTLKMIFQDFKNFHYISLNGIITYILHILIIYIYIYLLFPMKKY